MLRWHCILHGKHDILSFQIKSAVFAVSSSSERNALGLLVFRGKLTATLKHDNVCTSILIIAACKDNVPKVQI